MYTAVERLRHAYMKGYMIWWSVGRIYAPRHFRPTFAVAVGVQVFIAITEFVHSSQCVSVSPDSIQPLFCLHSRGEEQYHQRAQHAGHSFVMLVVLNVSILVTDLSPGHEPRYKYFKAKDNISGTSCEKLICTV